MKLTLLIVAVFILTACSSNSSHQFTKYPRVSLSTLGLSSDEMRNRVVELSKPMYPRRAFRAGLEGYCIVSFDLSPEGTTFNRKVVECSHNSFKVYSLLSVKNTTFEKPLLNEERVVVEDIKWRVSFAIGY